MSSPFDGMDPAMLQQLLGGGAQGQNALLAEQLRQAQALATPSQTQHTTGYGAGWSALGNAIGAAVGGTRAAGIQQQLAGNQAQSDDAFMRALLGGGMQKPPPPAPAPIAPPPMPGAPGAPPRLLTPGAPRVASPAVLLGQQPAPSPASPPAAAPESRAEMERRLGFLSLASGRKDLGDQLLSDAHFLTEREEKRDGDTKAAGEKVTTLENSLRGELQKNSRIALLQLTADNYRAIRGAPNDGTGDMTRIYSMAKTEDPTGSVRDSDVDMQIQSGGLKGMAGAFLKKLKSDGTLPDEVRAQMDKEIRRIYLDRLKQAKPAREAYRKLASEMGANPDHVDLDLGLDSVDTPKRETRDLPNGKTAVRDPKSPSGWSIQE